MKPYYNCTPKWAATYTPLFNKPVTFLINLLRFNKTVTFLVKLLRLKKLNFDLIPFFSSS